LSEGGEEVFKRCQEMVNAARSVMEISGQFTHEAEGLVRVSVPKAVGRFVVHPYMPEFLRRYPKVDVQLILEDRQVDLIDDNVDLSIRITDSPPRAWWGGNYCPSNTCCARRRSTWPSTARRVIPMICWRTVASTWRNPGDSRWKFRRAGKAVTVGVRGRYAANHTGVRLDAVLQHVGIGSLPYFTARHALDEGRLVQVLPEWDFIASYHGEAWLLHSPTRYLPPKVRVFIDYLVACMATEPTLRRR